MRGALSLPVGKGPVLRNSKLTISFTSVDTTLSSFFYSLPFLAWTILSFLWKEWKCYKTNCLYVGPSESLPSAWGLSQEYVVSVTTVHQPGRGSSPGSSQFCNSDCSSSGLQQNLYSFLMMLIYRILSILVFHKMMSVLSELNTARTETHLTCLGISYNYSFQFLIIFSPKGTILKEVTLSQ